MENPIDLGQILTPEDDLLEGSTIGGGQNYFAKVDNLWEYHQLKLAEDSIKVTAIITP